MAGSSRPDKSSFRRKPESRKSKTLDSGFHRNDGNPLVKNRPAPIKKKSSAPNAGTNYPGHIRLIGGQWRSRKLPVLISEGLRPTPDRVRETLFNWLSPVLPGARCLDLFAGTGALCLEALSRGAGEVVMVEREAKVVARLNENLQRLRAEHATVLALDAMQYLSLPVTPFDIVFLDPPFRSDYVAQGAALLAEKGWVSPRGLVYVEAPESLWPLPVPAAWFLLKSKKAGQVGYHLFQVP